jgi:NTE family protein
VTKSATPKFPAINLALQGGGSHGAFTWGVLDFLLEHNLVNPAAVSGSSAGAMNAVALAHGWMTGQQDGARHALATFWLAVSKAGMVSSPINAIAANSGALNNPFVAFWNSANAFWMESMLRGFSPYQLNPANVNPLRSILESQIDFEQLRSEAPFLVMIAATRVRDGRLKIFRESELSVDVTLASACLPTLFQAVQIEGDFYWDGGYTADPALWPFFYESKANDTVLFMVNPLERPDLPKKPDDIVDRLNEVSFNASLLSELRSVAFVQRMHSEGWLKPEFAKKLRNPRIHALLADAALSDLSVSSKMRTDWAFLSDLKDRGRKSAQIWWETAGPCIGKRSSFDLRQLL